MICPRCSGEMWDNRKKKKSSKAPDYVCKNKDTCKWTWKWNAETNTGTWERGEYPTSVWETQIDQILAQQPKLPTNEYKDNAITQASELKADTITLTSALKNAVELYSGTPTTIEKVLETADKFYDWLLKKSNNKTNDKPKLTATDIDAVAKDLNVGQKVSVNPNNPMTAQQKVTIDNSIDYCFLLQDQKDKFIADWITKFDKPMNSWTFGEAYQVVVKLKELSRSVEK